MKIISIKKRKNNFIVKLDLEYFENNIIGLDREFDINKQTLQVDKNSIISAITKEGTNLEIKSLNEEKEELSTEGKIISFFKKHEKKIKKFLLPLVIVQALSGTAAAAQDYNESQVNFNKPSISQTYQMDSEELSNQEPKIKLGSLIQSDKMHNETEQRIANIEELKYELEDMGDLSGVYIEEELIGEIAQNYIDKMHNETDKNGDKYTSTQYFKDIINLKIILSGAGINFTENMEEDLKDLKTSRLISAANDQITERVFEEINKNAMTDLEELGNEIKGDFIYDYPEVLEKVKNVKIVFQKYDAASFSGYAEHLDYEEHPTIKIQLNEKIMKMYYEGSKEERENIIKVIKNIGFHEMSHAVKQTSEKEAVSYHKYEIEGEIKEILQNEEIYHEYTAKDNINELFQKMTKANISSDKLEEMKKIVKNEETLKEIFKIDTLKILDKGRDGQGIVNGNEYLSIIAGEEPTYSKKQMRGGEEHYSPDLPAGYLFNTLKVFMQADLIDNDTKDKMVDIIVETLNENYSQDISSVEELKKVIKKTADNLHQEQENKNKFNIDKDINEWFSQVKFKTELPKEVSKLAFNNYDKVKENQQKLNKPKTFSNTKYS